MPNSLRLFTGLALEYPVRRNLELVLEHLRPLASLKWSPAANFHITTKFIGNWPEDRLEELKTALTKMPKTGPIEARIGGFGWFPNPHHPRVLFAGVRATGNIHTLHQQLNVLLQSMGLEPEPREFTPHLTLARVAGEQDLAALRQAIAQLPSAEFGISTAHKMLLYKSEGGSYTVIGEVAL